MIWIIGGTSEAKKLISKLQGITKFVVSVATYSGAEVIPDQKAIVGRMDCNDMVRFIQEKGIDTVVDMSHPYALEVTENAKAASAAAGAEYIRFVRKSSDVKDCLYFSSIEECALFLKGVRGCVFFTTGIKNISDFQKVRGENRFIYRVLPSVFSIQECVRQDVGMQDIIAVLGPVSEYMNYSMFKDYKADYVVMKDSGKEGGTSEKVEACRRLGITPIIVKRMREEKGITDLNELLKILI